MELKQILIAFVALLAFATNAHCDSAEGQRRSVFKIAVVSQSPDFQKPWKMDPTQESSGTGFYIGHNRILTNAHVVANARYITVQRDGDPIREPATVTFIAHDADLAIITARNKDYFNGMTALKFGGMPRLRSPVATVGYPTGGDQLSVTKGIVSRVGYRAYVHSGAFSHLLIQVDSAINPGNSGGPVFQDNNVVGVAFQSFVSAASIGYIIPTPVIARFLKDIADGTYDGHVEDGLETRRWSAANPAAMKYYGMGNQRKGVTVTHVYPWSCLAEHIQVNDLLLEINGKDIGVDGKIDFQGERVDFNTTYDLSQIGEKISFVLKRQKEIKKIEVAVAKDKKHYFRGNLYSWHPRYFIFGGLVFTTLSKEYLKEWGDKWQKLAPNLIKYLHFSGQFDPDFANTPEFVVLATRLSHPINTYIDSQTNAVVKSVNGRAVAGLEDLIHHLENNDDEFISIEFLGDDEPAVLRRSDVRLANHRILEQYGIDQDRWTAGSEVDGADVGSTAEGQHE